METRTVLQTPSVATSTVDNKIAFLQSKNLTQEEISAALAKADAESAHVFAYSGQARPSYGQYPPQYSPYGRPEAPPAMPRRDWRDWFIMATVLGSASYSLYVLGKRYIYPLIAPPTPDRLEKDKKLIDEQFERAFALVEKLAEDTESLKGAEEARTARLDSALSDLEVTINELKTANRRREDDGQRLRDDVRNLKDALPQALDKQAVATDNRLKEVNAELKSLKTLISQRMNATSSTSVNHYIRPSSGTVASSSALPAGGDEKAADGVRASFDEKNPDFPDQASAGFGSSSLFGSGIFQARTSSIPTWQMIASKSAASPAPTDPSAANGGEAASGSGSSKPDSA